MLKITSMETTITYQYRIKDSSIKKTLIPMSSEVNFVWNLNNNIIRKRWKESRFYTDLPFLNPLNKGASKELQITSRYTMDLTRSTEFLMALYEQASEAYYNDDPILSDDDFDLLRDELQRRDPSLPALKKVGVKPSSVNIWPEVPHRMPMGSQLKITTFDELESWSNKYTSKDLVWSEKLDGSSLELVYFDGVFKQAITRGNGEVGSDITPNVLLMGGYPKIIKVPGVSSVRAEMIMEISTWKQNFGQDKNPRNTAAGIARRKLDQHLCKNLQIVAYDVLFEQAKFEQKQQVFCWLQEKGFSTPLWGTGSALYVQEIFNHYQSEKRKNLNYEIDGIVVEDNLLANFERQGSVDGRPRASRAYKFQSEQTTTILRGVIWQVGRTGKVTPVADLEPAQVGGVTVSRATLNNMDYIKSRNIGIGSKVVLVRCNDVIPGIEASLSLGEPVQPPTNCPTCNSVLVLVELKNTTTDESHLYCQNNDCPDRVVGQIRHYLSAINAKGLGDKVIEAMVNANMIGDPSDLYRLFPSDIASLEGFGLKNAIKAVKDLHAKSRQVTLPVFIKSLGIPGFSEGKAELALEHLPTLTRLRNATVEEFLLVPQLGPESALAAVKGFQAKSELIDKLLNYVEFKEVIRAVSNKLAGKSFCFTGFRSKEHEDRIVSLGGKIASGVSKNTTYVVAESPQGSSGKLAKARQLGISILGLSGLNTLLGGFNEL